MPGAPWPLVEIRVAPTTRHGRSGLRSALLDLVIEGSDLDFSTDPACDQFILKAATDACLSGAIERLRSCPVGFDIGERRVAYRERLIERREIDYTNRHAFGRVKLLFEPSAPGTGFALHAKVAESVLPREYVRGVERGLDSVLMAGVLAGCPVIDIRAELVDGAYHAADSSPAAFEVAGRAAFREALQDNTVLTEPVMVVEIAVPEHHADRVVADLQARRGLIRDTGADDGVGAVTALVPLAELFGFDAHLQSAAGADARCVMAFDHYAPVPSADLDRPPVAAALLA